MVSEFETGNVLPLGVKRKEERNHSLVVYADPLFRSPLELYGERFLNGQVWIAGDTALRRSIHSPN